MGVLNMISTDKEFEVFDNFAGKFGFGKLQDIIQIKKYLEHEGYSIDDVEGFVDWKMKKEEEKIAEEIEYRKTVITPIVKEATEKYPMCPECEDKLFPVSIKQEEGVGNIHGYKTVWQCSGEECFYEKYNKEPIDEIIASFVGEEKTKKLSFEVSG
jgi:hypothetical protein